MIISLTPRKTRKLLLRTKKSPVGERFNSPRGDFIFCQARGKRTKDYGCARLFLARVSSRRVSRFLDSLFAVRNVVAIELHAGARNYVQLRGLSRILGARFR